MCLECSLSPQKASFRAPGYHMATDLRRVELECTEDPGVCGVHAGVSVALHHQRSAVTVAELEGHGEVVKAKVK